MLKKFWNYVSLIGAYDYLSDRFKRKIRFSNQISKTIGLIIKI
jgi:hypothetical protein